MNDKRTIKLISIEGRWGQILYPTAQKQPSVAQLLIKEQSKYCVPLCYSYQSPKNKVIGF